MRSQHKRSKIIIIKFIRENRAKKVLLIDFKHAIKVEAEVKYADQGLSFGY